MIQPVNESFLVDSKFQVTPTNGHLSCNCGTSGCSHVVRVSAYLNNQGKELPKKEVSTVNPAQPAEATSPQASTEGPVSADAPLSRGKNIYEKINAVMRRVLPLPKDGHNDYHNYAYTTEDQIVTMLRPILAEEGLALIPTCKSQTREGEFTKVLMQYKIVDVETKETETVEFHGEGQDKNDKGLYKAYTGAYKYCLTELFLLGSQDDPEKERDSGNPGASRRQPPPKQQTRSSGPPPKTQNLASGPAIESQKKAIETLCKTIGSNTVEWLQTNYETTLDQLTQDTAAAAISKLNLVRAGKAA